MGFMHSRIKPFIMDEKKILNFLEKQGEYNSGDYNYSHR